MSNKPCTIAILGRKIGMTRFFLDNGKNIPVTVIEAGPCVVTQVKTADRHGYSAGQIAFEDIDRSRHLAKGTARLLGE